MTSGSANNKMSDILDKTDPPPVYPSAGGLSARASVKDLQGDPTLLIHQARSMEL